MSGQSHNVTPVFVVVMGVSGSGKTTIGRALASRLGWRFYDADDHHPASNVEKMRQGTPLTDEDRAPWLAALRRVIDASIENREPGILACSALKQRYRDVLTGPRLRFVHLRGDLASIRARMEGRQHFMPVKLLESQFLALEEPVDAIVVDVTLSVEAQVDYIVAALKEATGPT
ncbi:MAG: gluconokinase [Thermoflexales bacterium]